MASNSSDVPLPIGHERFAFRTDKFNSAMPVADEDETTMTLNQLREGSQIERADGSLSETANECAPALVAGDDAPESSRFLKQACRDEIGCRRSLFETLSLMLSTAFEKLKDVSQAGDLTDASTLLLTNLYNSRGLLYDRTKLRDCSHLILAVARELCKMSDEPDSNYSSKWHSIQATEGDASADDFQMSCAATAYIAGIALRGPGRVLSARREGYLLRSGLNRPGMWAHGGALTDFLELVKDADMLGPCLKIDIPPADCLEDFALKEQRSDVTAFRALFAPRPRTDCPSSEWHLLNMALTHPERVKSQ